MTCAAGERICHMCGEIVSATPPCPVCVGREAGAALGPAAKTRAAQVATVDKATAARRDEFAPESWAPAGDARQSYDDEMAAMVAEGAGL